MAKYAYNREDGSWFGEDNLSIVDVPDHITDPDDIEEYLTNCDLHEEDLYKSD